MLPTIIFIVLMLYLAVSMAYAVKIDNVLYYEYHNLTDKEKNRLIVYCLFWIIFFIKLDKIIKKKK